MAANWAGQKADWKVYQRVECWAFQKAAEKEQK